VPPLVRGMGGDDEARRHGSVLALSPPVSGKEMS